jgi:hypothetical protein
MPVQIGVIADTHGMIRPKAREFLAGCDWIVHAGDIGSLEILDELKSMAPTFAIRGNMDKGPWAEELPHQDVVEVAGKELFLIHNWAEMDLDPVAAGWDAVVWGHSHRPENYRKDGVLYLNPGSAGPKRFRLAVTMGRLIIEWNRLDGEILLLEP